MGKTLFKILSLQIIPPESANKTKTWKKVRKIFNRLKKYHCRDLWKPSPLLWNMPVNSKGEPEYVADLSEVFASASH
jgi:hypothetical protein